MDFFNLEQIKPFTKVAIIAGETSGDILGAGLMKELKKLHPTVTFEGIGGSLMAAQGLNSLFPMERLSVMGIIPILKRLPELLRRRKELIQQLKSTQPDVVIGIDAPEFTLGVEKALKQAGIKTVHYVSPSVWAWRPKRIHKIKQSTDLMLCLFPFEQEIYQHHAIDNFCVGHTLADQIPLQSDKKAARTKLSLLSDIQLLCLMPGSRGSELAYLSEDFITMAAQISEQYPQLRFIAPMANEKRREQFIATLDKLTAKKINVPNITVTVGNSRDCMIASDYIVMASGTATLEAMLVKRPTVVAYKVGALSYRIFKKLLLIDTFAIPNLLAKKELMPELIQDDCTAENLAAEVKAWIDGDQEHWQATRQEFMSWHHTLRKNADTYAAKAITHWWNYG